jgi:DNA-binding response OmpR family regulator
MGRILILEDDENLRLVLADNLDDAGHQITEAANIAQAQAALQSHPFDLLILDLMLPDGDGYSLCHDYRANGGRAPVLMLTARTLEDDLVAGFDAGADDYLTKPYRLRELMARVTALLRRAGTAPTPAPRSDRFGPWQIDHHARQLLGPNGALELTRTEFDLLAFLVGHPGQALSRDAILDAVWGREVVVDTRTVDNFVSNLKRKLGWQADAQWRIHTVRGVGYRFEVCEQ